MTRINTYEGKGNLSCRSGFTPRLLWELTTDFTDGERVQGRELGNALQPSLGTSRHPLPEGEGRKLGMGNGAWINRMDRIRN